MGLIVAMLTVWLRILEIQKNQKNNDTK
jgi:hypothetical protein